MLLRHTCLYIWMIFVENVRKMSRKCGLSDHYLLVHQFIQMCDYHKIDLQNYYGSLDRWFITPTFFSLFHFVSGLSHTGMLPVAAPLRMFQLGLDNVRPLCPLTFLSFTKRDFQISTKNISRNRNEK